MQPSRRATGCGGHLVLSSVLFLLLVPSAHAFTPATPRQRRAAALLHHHQRSPAPAMGWETTRPSVLLRLGAFGAGVGPFVDAVHNQALLQYDVLPVEVQLVDARTSALVPPLLFLAYAILGGVGPAIAEALLPSRDDDDAPASAMAARGRATTALLAVASTIGIIKLSELLVLASVPPAAALALLLSLCALQWRLLVGRAGGARRRGRAARGAANHGRRRVALRLSRLLPAGGVRRRPGVGMVGPREHHGAVLLRGDDRCHRAGPLVQRRGRSGRGMTIAIFSHSHQNRL